MFPLPLDMYFEIGAFLTSVICLYKIKNRPLRWFIPFLFTIVIVEFIGRYIALVLIKNNSLIYNISIPIEYFFYTYLFSVYYKNSWFKKISKRVLVFIPILSLINMLFLQGFTALNTNILKIGSLLMIIQSCIFFIDIFETEEEVYLLKEPMFWITTGLLFFNLGELSYNLFFQYLLTHTQDPSAKLFSSINGKLIYFFYTFISIGLLCQKKYQKESGQLS